MRFSIRTDASLRGLNTFGVEALARRLIEVDDDTALEAAIAACGPDGPALILGGGSNLLITGDIDGTVLRVATRGHRIVERTTAGTVVEALAGTPWHDFVGWTLDQGLAGLENLSLIPGTVGAAPVQNIGAYGVELAERFDSLRAIDLRSGESRRFDREECRFGYRDSLFKRPQMSHWLIRSVRMLLRADLPLTIGYGDIGQELQRRQIGTPVAADVARAVIAIRQRRLPDPARIGNAGSFFKNPLVDAATAGALRANYPSLPVYPAGGPDDPRRKLSAAWMIEQCGWKGQRSGDAGVYAQHALVLVNHGTASGTELLALAMRIRESVQARFGVSLQPEPVIVPAPDAPI